MHILIYLGRLKKLCWIGCAALIVLTTTVLLAELACRISYEKITSKSGRWVVAIAESDTFLRYDGVDKSIERPRFLPHPYLLYQATPNYIRGGALQHNSLGYRQEEFAIEKKKNTTRILALGGSTTYGASVPLPQSAWPHQLQLLLNKVSTAKNYEVINGGLDSAASPEILSGWVFRHRHLKPDVVILNVGVNDVSATLATRDYSPEYKFFRRSFSVNQPRRRIRKLLKVSYLAKVFYATMNLSEDAAYPFVQAADLDNRTSEHASQAVTKRVMETDPIGFKRNLDLLIKLVKLEGAKVYVVMEPVLSEEMIRKHVAETNADDWLTGLEHPWHLSLQKHYEIMKNIARENHVPYLWINSADFKYEWFADSHHLKEPGEEAKARVIMDGLTDSRVVSLMKNGGEGDRTLYP